jgi:starch synthase (maltosyl-transferring)
MEYVDNDRWAGRFSLDANTRWVFTIEALADPFRSWLDDLRKRTEAGQAVASELREGAALVRGAAERAVGEARRRLLEYATRVERTEEQATAVAAAREPELLALMNAHLDRSDATWAEREYEIMADRERARFAAWYEFFPRSGSTPGRSATFREAEVQLARAAAMGFDVVYLPPIHPIGRAHRKGRNNTLVAVPGDPGSPWAIGGVEGGHMAVHPDLGTLDDFDRFVAAAARLGLEVALDFAIQASPDHPYVQAHPEWFFHRPDGTIKYAENPPKKYQDVYPLNFYGADPEPLWQEMRAVVEFWIEHGVRTFRVDNPHTKPVRFWEWLIREIQAEHPDVIFLAEAFTRPKMMKVLAKAGFTQSYTYFTWRNDKAELTEYFTEITRPPVSDYFRGHLWPNTPDILHATLQSGGRPAFALRLALAATLSSLYGIYSGYELCENVPFAPGSEEYLHSEKYEIKARDWNAAGNLVDYIRRLNRIRRDNRALQLYDNLQFFSADDAHILWYGKMTPARDNVVLVAVNLDPVAEHASLVDVPLDALGLREDEPYWMHELLRGERYRWQGRRGYVKLDPAVEGAQIFRLERS